ncbi:hypothetical protein PG994_002394 [Apiospora phragmitis]|uniref:2EXR domain-containing protein n=1 Tax=Apiospora phragmitis TaxID=2905665 RepID=A0ABR1WWA8_9PEZI
MSSPASFSSLPLEIRQMIWKEALHEEIESRMVIVHRVTMRVMPHTSTKSLVMNTNQESRNYALRYFYDVKLDVWTLAVNFNPHTEVVEYGKTPLGQRHEWLGLLEATAQPSPRITLRCRLVASSSAAPASNPGCSSDEDMEGSPETQRKGAIYLSSQHDRFALAKKTLTKGAP